MTSICLFVPAKNEAHRLGGLLRSCVRDADRIVVLADVDSEDNTRDVALAFTPHVYPVRFADSFSDLLTLGLHLCRPQTHGLWLDCDEALSPEAWPALREHARDREITCLRRRRWADAARTVQVEPGNPDWQPRLLPTDGRVRFERRLHPRAVGAEHHRPEDPRLYIDHYQDLKTAHEMALRQQLYVRLAALDGIAVEGGQPLDRECLRCGRARRDHEGATAYATPPFRATGTPTGGCEGFE